MSRARWDREPAPARSAGKPRAPVARGTWECRTCGEILTGTYKAAERHANAHGGARLESVIRGA